MVNADYLDAVVDFSHLKSCYSDTMKFKIYVFDDKNSNIEYAKELLKSMSHRFDVALFMPLYVVEKDESGLDTFYLDLTRISDKLEVVRILYSFIYSIIPVDSEFIKGYTQFFRQMDGMWYGLSTEDLRLYKGIHECFLGTSGFSDEEKSDLTKAMIFDREIYDLYFRRWLSINSDFNASKYVHERLGVDVMTGLFNTLSFDITPKYNHFKLKEFECVFRNQDLRFNTLGDSLDAIISNQSYFHAKTIALCIGYLRNQISMTKLWRQGNALMFRDAIFDMDMRYDNYRDTEIRCSLVFK